MTSMNDGVIGLSRWLFHFFIMRTRPFHSSLCAYRASTACRVSRIRLGQPDEVAVSGIS